LFDSTLRKTPTLEFVDYLKAAYGEQQPFSFEGEHHTTKSATLSVQPVQKPHPPIWMQSRDPETLEFCAKNGLNTGYFLIYPREDARPRYLKFLEDWNKAGWDHKPNIAYCTLVYVDETDEKAIDKALKHAARAYEGFLPPPEPGETFEERVARHSKKFNERGEDGAAVIMANIFDADYLMENDLVFIGSPETVTKKLRKYAEDGVFNTFMGEFNFHELEEEDIMRSVKLFGEQVMPELKDFEPY
jgi:alkanesulfonate monooxygenase SsuD/methylene tetrahydromethanopterin reductase-like flavin-dependent oxidoreductase (luciferase family)